VKPHAGFGWGTTRAHSSAHMIISTVRLAISEQHRSEVLRTLRVLMGHATAKSGCEGFSIAQDVCNPETLTVCEQWATREDLEGHVRSADYRLLLAVIDLSVTAPEISFDDLGHLGGLELVQALRSQQCTAKEDRT
jgi:quinol monooxygenase YgiN